MTFGQGTIYKHVGGKTEKHRVSGYRMYKSDKVISCETSVVQDGTCARGKVQASFKSDVYSVRLILSQVTGHVTNAKCTCKAGAVGQCKHIAAFLYQINDFKESGLQTIPVKLACTSKARIWGVPSKLPMKIQTKSFAELQFVNFVPGARKRTKISGQYQKEEGVL